MRLEPSKTYLVTYENKDTGRLFVREVTGVDRVPSVFRSFTYDVKEA